MLIDRRRVRQTAHRVRYTCRHSHFNRHHMRQTCVIAALVVQLQHFGHRITFVGGHLHLLYRRQFTWTFQSVTGDASNANTLHNTIGARVRVWRQLCDQWSFVFVQTIDEIFVLAHIEWQACEIVACMSVTLIVAFQTTYPNRQPPFSVRNYSNPNRIQTNNLNTSAISYATVATLCPSMWPGLPMFRTNSVRYM